MHPELIEGLIAITGIATFGTFFLVAMRMRLNARRMPASDPEIERITAAVDELSEQNRMLTDEVVELQERLDFHERVLTSQNSEKALADTPA